MTGITKVESGRTAQEEDTPSQMRHRAANTLQLLSAVARMRSQKADEVEIRRQLLWVTETVGVLGALERHRQGSDVDFPAYLREMASIWRRRHRLADGALVVVTAQPIMVGEVQASTLALIVHELAANALSHGMVGTATDRIELHLIRRGENQLELVVRDEGQGFDAQVPQSSEHFGLWLVRSLADQLRGQFDLQSHQGTTARLTFTASR